MFLFDTRTLLASLIEIQSSIPAIKKYRIERKRNERIEGYFLILIMQRRIERVASEVRKFKKKFPSSINDSFYIKSLRDYTEN